MITTHRRPNLIDNGSISKSSSSSITEHRSLKLASFSDKEFRGLYLVLLRFIHSPTSSGASCAQCSTAPRLNEVDSAAGLYPESSSLPCPSCPSLLDCSVPFANNTFFSSNGRINNHDILTALSCLFNHFNYPREEAKPSEELSNSGPGRGVFARFQ